MNPGVQHWWAPIQQTIRLAIPAATGMLLIALLAVPRGWATDDGVRAMESCGPSSLQVRIAVENVRNSDGLVTAVLYGDNPRNFLKKGRRVGRVRVAAKQGPMRLCLAAPAPGKYAVALFHDENANKRLDQGFLGIPTEGYGFSNNPGIWFGPPDLADALFSVGDRPICR